MTASEKRAKQTAYMAAAQNTYENDDIQIATERRFVQGGRNLSEVQTPPIGSWVLAWVWVNEFETHSDDCKCEYHSDESIEAAGAKL